MGLKTLADFRASVNVALGEKSQFDERLDDWVNAGLQELFAILDVEARRTTGTVNTVADSETVALPADLTAVLNVTDTTNKRRLIKTSIENFQAFNPGNTGISKYYARVDRELFLHPVPTEILPLHLVYIKEAIPLTADDDVTELGAQYDRIVHLLAVRSALIDLHQEERATFMYQVAMNALAAIQTAFEMEAQAPAEGIRIARNFEDLQRR